MLLFLFAHVSVWKSGAIVIGVCIADKKIEMAAMDFYYSTHCPFVRNQFRNTRIKKIHIDRITFFLLVGKTNIAQCFCLLLLGRSFKLKSRLLFETQFFGGM